MSEEKVTNNTEIWLTNLVDNGHLYYLVGDELQEVYELVISDNAGKYIHFKDGGYIGKYPLLDGLRIVV